MRRFAPVAVAGLLFLAGCGSGKTKDDVGLKVLAAQSLSAVFPRLKAAYEKDHPHVTVDASFGGSSLLATQIQQGAPGDIFISADEANMKKVTKAPTVIVARNLLEIIVAPGNPKHITGLADLTVPGLRIALCDVAVPCGAYAAQAFAKAGVSAPAASREANVAGVVTKVTTREADAGVVYVTDVRAAGAKATGVEIPAGDNVPASYPAVVLESSGHPHEAADFVKFLRGVAAQRLLKAAGFTAV